MEEIAGIFVLFVLPILAVVWPVVTVATAEHRPRWRRWAVGGCLLLAVVLVPLGPFIAGDVVGDDTPTFLLMGAVAWVLGVLNAAIGLVVGLVVPSGRSWTFVAIPTLIVVLTYAGIRVVTWPGLPPVPQPASGQLTGVVGEHTMFGWRATDQYTTVVAVPVESGDDLKALAISGDTTTMGEAPVHGLSIWRDGLADIAGVGVATIVGARFTIDGLADGSEYWICAGSDAPRPGVLAFDVCDRPPVEAPGALRVAFSPQNPRVTVRD